MPVPQSREEFDPSTLRDPELDPLVNPLLAANMGRWAEVYFTAPPEKRDEAIHELLRELRNDSPLEPYQPRAGNHASSDKPQVAEPPRSFPWEPVVTCSACAHNNAVGQSFCGMCGAPLTMLSEGDRSQDVETAPIAEESLSEPEPSRNADEADRSIDPALDRGNRDVFVLRQQLSQNDFPSFAVEPEAQPYRYRVYVGVALAALLGILVYMAWHRTDALSGSAARHPALSSAVPAEPPGPTSSAPQPSAAPSTTDTALATEATSRTIPPATAPEKPSASLSRGRRISQPRPTERAVDASAKSPEVASGQSGAEELAIAEKYLSGGSGTARDSREAAQWLWKAVGKGNLGATVTLSDLYLRGDGVPKSCDQGRLLLDAAARKGATGAAERLRHLQAFGCQ
jgi:hypothetical protein